MHIDHEHKERYWKLGSKRHKKNRQDKSYLLKERVYEEDDEKG